ncbi:Ribonuclease kappa [Armadillidium nasatum]|uniref:Ribonuclease kappa n=1 Tax=Armadillidium nasatum TaxID=96803 RepID=A0A5N5T9G9_9CRUS|nr:Ribonuclease kappa [Armadillidium nasatum]KAB7501725.1 Ribonuclease kappa [Armadillidium nasatum]
MGMKFCGPKYSLCCGLTSAWGIIQLILMGVFFKIRSPALIEDLHIPEEAHHNQTTYLEAMNDSYDLIGTNCFIAAALYAGTLVVCSWQFWLNLKS